jgi:uncharacterized DUF497 family protein
MGDVNYKKPVKFVWDRGNKDKSWLRHRVANNEAEEVFFDPNKQEYPDPRHSGKEIRKIIVGKTKKERLLFVAFTFRGEAIRIISARDLNKGKEVRLYEKAD